MKHENGFFYMDGLPDGDPRALKTPEQAIEFIEKRGLVPLFSCEAAGFSLEEQVTCREWWTGSAADPWEWREIIAASGRVAYGKLFGTRMGFCSLALFPYLCAYRRDGYDFDTLIEMGKAPMRERVIMDALKENDEPSYRIRRIAGFGKDGYKGYETNLSSLMNQTYLVIRDFARKRKKNGEEYGWPVAYYTTPERRFGEELVRSAYTLTKEQAAERLMAHLRAVSPETPEQALRALIG